MAVCQYLNAKVQIILEKKESSEEKFIFSHTHTTNKQ